jgi:hypothetical protein
VGKSGWDPKVVRPEFEEMMSAVRAGHVDAVVMFSLSRLTRQGALEAMLINKELAKHGVLLVSVEEPYLDTSTPMGVAIFGLIAALAEQESDMKSAYITATKETRRFAAQADTGERQAELAAARAELEHVREALRTLYVDRQAGLYAGAVGDQMFRESVERLTAHEARTAGRVEVLGTAEADTVAIPSEWTAPEGDPLGPESTWAGWDLSARREFLALFVDRVSVARSVGRGRNANTAERVAVHWTAAPAK